MAIREGQTLNEVHGDGVPWAVSNWKKAMWTKGLVVNHLALSAGGARVDVVSDESDQSGPEELPLDVINHFCDARVVIMVRTQDIQVDIMVVRDIQSTFTK